MAKFQPGKITDEEVQISDDGMKLTLTLPHKTFSSGRKGFFKQGMYTAPDGTQYRLNMQAYKVEPKAKKNE